MSRITYIPNRVIDSDGISDGAVIYVYESGGTTPVSLFSDEGLTVPLSNPFNVPAGAAVDPFFTNYDGNIRVRVVSTAGVVQQDDDPYGTPALIPDLGSSDPTKGASMIKVEDGRTAQEVVNEIIDINIDRWYTSDNWADAIEEAVTLADSVGGRVVHTPGVDYGATRAPVIVDKNVRIDWAGARVLRKNHEDGETTSWTMFSPTFSYSSAVSISTITTDSIMIDGSASTTPVTKMTLAAGSVTSLGLAKGVKVKVVSDDLIPWSVDANNERLGQHGMIYAADSDTDEIWFYTELALASLMSTTPRLAKMSDKICILDNVWIEDDPDNDADTSGALLDIVGAYMPIIRNSRCEFSRSQFARLTSCYKARVYGLNADDLNTNYTNGVSGQLNRYGYGWHDFAGSTETQLYDMSGSRFRHIVDTGAPGMATPETSVVNYGGSVNLVCDGGTASDGQWAAFGTHPDSFNATFRNLSVLPSFVGKEAGIWEFQGRGERTSFENCTSTGRGAIRFIFFGSGSRGTIKNHTHTNTGSPSTLGIFEFTGTDATGTPVVSVLDCNIDVATTTGKIFTCEECEADIDNLHFRGQLTGTAQANRVIETNARVSMRRSVLDIRGSTTVQPLLVYCSGASADALIDDVEVICTDNTMTVLVGQLNNTAAKVVGRRINIINGVTNSTGFSSSSSGTAYADVIYDGGFRQGPNVMTANYNNAVPPNDNRTLSLSGKGMANLFFIPNVTVAGISIGTISTALFIGQKLSIWSNEASTESVAIPASTNVLLGSTVNLAANEVLHLVARPDLKWVQL